MSRIIFDASLIKTISLFESVTGAKVKDCVKDDCLLFIIEAGDMGKAIGKGGKNIKKLEQSLKKKVKVAEFNEDVLVFLENLAYPAKVANSSFQEGIIIAKAADTRSRGLLIGKGGTSLRFFEKVLQRYFDVKEIKVES